MNGVERLRGWLYWRAIAQYFWLYGKRNLRPVALPLFVVAAVLGDGLETLRYDQGLSPLVFLVAQAVIVVAVLAWRRMSPEAVVSAVPLVTYVALAHGGFLWYVIALLVSLPFAVVGQVYPLTLLVLAADLVAYGALSFVLVDLLAPRPPRRRRRWRERLRAATRWRPQQQRQPLPSPA